MIVFGLLAPVFFAGILMFLAPCTLPIVPGYLAFVSGVHTEDLKDPNKRKNAELKIKKNSIFFILGFSLTFVLLGIILGLFGSILGIYKEVLLRIGGVLIFLFGLMMLKISPTNFLSSTIKIPKWITVGHYSSSFVLGAIFALGWSPCVGPLLGTVLILAGTLQTVLQGGILLLVFSLGLAIPFFLSAFLYTRSQNFFQRFSKVFTIFSFLGGILMLVIGVLLIFNKWYVFQEIGFEIFKFINYESIEKFL